MNLTQLGPYESLFCHFAAFAFFFFPSSILTFIVWSLSFNRLRSNGNYVTSPAINKSAFCIYGFCLVLAVNSDYFIKQYYEPVDFCNGAGTNWFLNYRLDEIRLQRINESQFMFYITEHWILFSLLLFTNYNYSAGHSTPWSFCPASVYI
jgi:hypothetical protein